MEVRTEEDRTPNHDGGKHAEPNETTPLTEPEYVGREGLTSSVEPHSLCYPGASPADSYQTLPPRSLQPGAGRPS